MWIWPRNECVCVSQLQEGLNLKINQNITDRYIHFPVWREYRR